MSNIRMLQIAANVVTAEVFFLFLMYLIVQGRHRSSLQRSFLGWLLSLSAAGMTGTVLLSTRNQDIAELVSKAHYTVLLLSAVTLWLFATQFRRDLSKVEMIALIPAGIAVPLIWTIATHGIVATTIGWGVVTTPWFFLFTNVLFGYYIAAEVHLVLAWRAVAKAGDKVSAGRMKVMVFSILALVLIGMGVPVSARIMESGWLTLAFNVCYIFPPLFIARTFRVAYGDTSL